VGEGKGSSAGVAFPVPLCTFENNLCMLSEFMEKKEDDEGD